MRNGLLDDHCGWVDQTHYGRRGKLANDDWEIKLNNLPAKD